MHRLIIAAVLLLSLQVQAQQKLSKNDLEDFKNRMVGNFDNQGQSSLDNSYKNISLHIKDFELKGKHPEGDYLYVEQAMSNMPTKPQRQLVYRLYRVKDTLINEVFELFTPDRLVGAWNNTDLLKKLTKDSLIKKEGCTIYFIKDDNGDYYGSTKGSNCMSSLKAATSATSEVILFPSMMISWDRGWDANNHQVWGPEKEGYKFRKFTNPHESND